jgi:hypothetical protein
MKNRVYVLEGPLMEMAEMAEEFLSFSQSVPVMSSKANGEKWSRSFDKSGDRSQSILPDGVSLPLWTRGRRCLG